MTVRASLKTIAKMVDLLRQTKDPTERLAAVRRLREAAEGLERDVVADARRSGLTWTAIGDVYGMSKQAAQQRFRGPDL